MVGPEGEVEPGGPTLATEKRDMVGPEGLWEAGGLVFTDEGASAGLDIYNNHFQKKKTRQ